MAIANSEIFFAVWLALYMPFAIVACYLFYIRSDIQPIKARHPKLTMVSNVILILFCLSLCLQRVIEANYPCWVTLWTGYCGTILVANAYLFRCWMLYFTFRSSEEMRDDTESSGNDSISSFFLYKKWLRDPKFVGKYMITVSWLLLVPCLVATIQLPEIRNFQGDGCNRGFADVVLAAYIGVYLFLFTLFAIGLKDFEDNFHIKIELRFIGISCILATVGWYIFNNSLTSLNNTFAFSTLCLLAATTTSFIASTILPLYRSYVPLSYQSIYVTPDEVKTLPKLIATKIGYHSFANFLKREFALENILFYMEVMRLHDLGSEMLLDPSDDGVKACQSRALHIFEKFIAAEAPCQVNLPSKICAPLLSKFNQTFNNPNHTPRESLDSSLKRDLRTEYEMEESNVFNNRKPSDSTKDLDDVDLSSPVAREIFQFSHIYDAAQADILKLMTTDSYPRYLLSDLYSILLAELNKNVDQKQRLQELNVI